MKPRNVRRFSIDRLEHRLPLDGNLSASIIGGDLVLQGDDAANRVRIETHLLPQGQIRLAAGPVGTVNGETNAVILRGWNGDIHIDLGGGDDRVVFNALAVSGNVWISSGPGNDTVLFDRSQLARGLTVFGGTGNDSLHVVQSQVSGQTILQTGDGRDVVALSGSTFSGPVSVRTGNGNDTIQLRSNFNGQLAVDPGAGSNTVTNQGVAASFDFRNGAQGWQAGFADYPAGEEQLLELKSGIKPLPPELGIAGTGFFLSGKNHPDDLFMFLKRRLGRSDGLVPNQTYQVRLRIAVASNAPSYASGIGGAPGESVFLKAGANPVEPKRVTKDGFVEMNVEKGDQSFGGRAASAVGNIANGREISNSTDKYVSLVRAHVHTFLATASPNGDLWLLVGTDSGYEGTTSLYYQRIGVELIPVGPTAAPQPRALLSGEPLSRSPGERPRDNLVPSAARNTSPVTSSTNSTPYIIADAPSVPQKKPRVQPSDDLVAALDALFSADCK